MTDFRDLTDVTDAALANTSVKQGMGGGAATSVFGYLSSSDLLVILGVVTTVFGFITNLVFQQRRDKRAREEHELHTALLKAQLENEQKNSG